MAARERRPEGKVFRAASAHRRLACSSRGQISEEQSRFSCGGALCEKASPLFLGLSTFADT